MTRSIGTILQITAAVAAVAVMEYVFFRSPEMMGGPVQAAAQAASDRLERPGERRLKNIKQLTFGGENAEAYWSFDGKQLCFQSTRDNHKADQIYTMNADGTGVHQISNGKGRTTCSYFSKDGQRVFYASTHLGGDEPPQPPDMSMGYVWAVYPSYDIFSVKTDVTEQIRLTDAPGYDAEATLSPDGRTLVFTSTRDGDLDLYTMDTFGKNVKRLTRDLGYDGGAFFSPDGKKICYRANHPQTEEEQAQYKKLLARDLVKPSQMELWVMDADGSNKQQVTRNGAANFCPYFTPDGQRLIFASNMDDPRGRNFELYLINLDGTKLVWASNRNAKERGETNIFVADWAP